MELREGKKEQISVRYQHIFCQINIHGNLYNETEEVLIKTHKFLVIHLALSLLNMFIFPAAVFETACK